MYFRDGTIAIWFTVSMEDELDSEAEVVVAKNQHPPPDEKYMMTVVDTDSFKVFGKMVDVNSLSEGTTMSLGTILKNKRNISVKVVKEEEEGVEIYSVSMWIKDGEGKQSFRIVGPISLRPHDSRKSGLMDLFGNIDMDMQVMLKEKEGEAAETAAREIKYREVTRKMSERTRTGDSRMTELFAGFASILNDKNRQISKLKDALDDLARTKTRRSLPSAAEDEDLLDNGSSKRSSSSSKKAISTTALQTEGRKKRGRPSNDNFGSQPKALKQGSTSSSGSRDISGVSHSQLPSQGKGILDSSDED